MFKRVIAYPDGRVIFYYPGKTITYNKNKEPVVKLHHTRKYEYLGNSSNIFISSPSDWLH